MNLSIITKPNINMYMINEEKLTKVFHKKKAILLMGIFLQFYTSKIILTYHIVAEVRSPMHFRTLMLESSQNFLVNRIFNGTMEDMRTRFSQHRLVICRNKTKKKKKFRKSLDSSKF